MGFTLVLQSSYHASMLTFVKNGFSLTFRRPRLGNEAVSLRISWAYVRRTGSPHQNRNTTYSGNPYYISLPLSGLNG